MTYINKRASKFVRNYIANQVSKHSDVIKQAKYELDDIVSDYDKATFLRVILEENEKEYQKHLLVCTSKENCDTNYDHESITYYLTQELNRLGIRTDNDQFTIEEKELADSKLDQILSELQTLKAGQQIIYEDIRAELAELKELYILGKRKWHQLLLGKTAEMVVGGVISETVSKSIISTVGQAFSKMLSS